MSAEAMSEYMRKLALMLQARLAGNESAEDDLNAELEKDWYHLGPVERGELDAFGAINSALSDREYIDAIEKLCPFLRERVT